MNGQTRLRTPSILALLLLVPMLLGNDACDPANVAIGDEDQVIAQAWDTNVTSVHDKITRLELVARLEKRQNDRLRAEVDLLMATQEQAIIDAEDLLDEHADTLAYLEAEAAEMAWMHECYVQTAGPEAPFFSQFPSFGQFSAWCMATFYDGPLP